MSRKPYPSDVSDDEWAFVAPYLTLMSEDAGDTAADEAHAQGIRLEVISCRKRKRALCCCRVALVVERTFGWAARFRRLAREYERLPETLAGLHFLAFAVLMLKRFVEVMAQSS